MHRQGGLFVVGLALVTREAPSEQETLTRRAPALVAGVLGLAHGVGFAGGLTEAGLEGDGLLWSLALFNLGVEAAQLVVLAGAAAALALAVRSRHARRLRWGLAMGVGLWAGVWTAERAVLWAAPLGG